MARSSAARSASAEDLPEPEPVDQLPPEAGTAPLPGFSQPEIRPETSPASDQLGDGPDSSSPAASSRASTDLAKRKTHVKAAKDILSVLLQGGAALINSRVSLGEDDPSWLMDDATAQEIAAPVARIIVRRAPIPEGSDTSTSDIYDAATAVVGLVGYILGSWATRRAVRASQYAAAPRPEPVDDDADEYAPAPVATSSAVTMPYGATPYGSPA